MHDQRFHIEVGEPIDSGARELVSLNLPTRIERKQHQPPIHRQTQSGARFRLAEWLERLQVNSAGNDVAREACRNRTRYGDHGIGSRAYGSADTRLDAADERVAAV